MSTGSSHPPSTPNAGPSPQVPTALRVAAAVVAVVVAVEGAVGVVLGVAEAVTIDGRRLVLGLTTALFLLLYGAGLLLVARGLSRAASWSRGPAVFAQLIQLGVSWSFWGGSTSWVAVLLAISAVVVLAAIFQRASTEALTDSASP